MCRLYKRGLIKIIHIVDRKRDLLVQRKEQVMEMNREKVSNLARHTEGNLVMQYPLSQTYSLP